MAAPTKPKVSGSAKAKEKPLGQLDAKDFKGKVNPDWCPGCGDFGVLNCVQRACAELGLRPHEILTVSGIGCSSKTPAYFLREAHGFNSVHGRMPSIATGASAARRDMISIGISGDGDSLSIGLGQFCHAIRRNVRVVYILENNGVYGLTKGQFSASADIGSRPKRGEPNRQSPIDPVLLALNLGATFVARSFSATRNNSCRSSRRGSGTRDSA